MRSIIPNIMKHPSLIERPPVLIDIGASGSLPAQWKFLAPYSICVAFDADTRDFDIKETENKGWNKLFYINRLIASKTANNVDFFLTKSPYCSSSLCPDNESLLPWAFSPLFEVNETIKLPAVDLQSVLSKLGIDYIDWYKTDTQGTDQRLFDTLPKNVVSKIIAAEFEPGIIDAYLGEDKLHKLMAYMDKLPFWITHMEIKGSQRIDQDDLKSLSFVQQRSVESFLKTAPGWCEISYVNKLDDEEITCREFLLAWTVAYIKSEHGFALHVAKKGQQKFGEPIFFELQQVSRQKLSSVSGYTRFGLKVLKRIARLAR